MKRIKPIKLNRERVMIAIGIIAVLFYMCFNAVVPFDYYNHDLGGVGSGRGHMGYILYIFNNLSLPVFSINPTTIESFYNPPLYYVLAADWFGITHFFTHSEAELFESLQILTCLFAGGVLYFFYRILNLFQIRYKLLLWIFICFNPSMFILSSLINNDGLAFLTTIATFYYGLKWYKTPQKEYMIYAALWCSASLLTKFGGVTIIPVLGLLFIIKLFQNQRKWKTYIQQALIFFAILLPLGGGYYMYAYVKYDVPPNFVQGWKDPYSDIALNHSWYERFTHDEWKYPYVNLDSQKNWNLMLLGIKTSLFNEFNYQNGKTLDLLGHILFYTAVSLFIITILSLIYGLLYDSFTQFSILPTICSLYILISFIGYIYFNYQFPHIWTSNFRYIPIYHICSALLLENCMIRKNIIGFIVPILMVVFSIVSFFFYLLLFCYGG